MTTTTVRRYRSRAARLGYGAGFVIPLAVALVLVASAIVTALRLVAFVLSTVVGGVA